MITLSPVTLEGHGVRLEPLTPGHLAALKLAAADGELWQLWFTSVPTPDDTERYIADALRFYMEFHQHYDGFYGAFIHDALAVAAALDPSLITTRAVAVDVELGGTLTTGETVTDWRGVWGRPPNVDVAVAADAQEFLRRFVERVGRLAAAVGS